MSEMVPASGGPSNDDTPWHMITKPNAVVSFSSPISSTIIIERSDTNTAIHVPKTAAYNANK
uniref:Uncharacterized protein n=1 Tax=Arion vulgaris TaxID=1028688 RepID=A0A0B7B7Q3_9EUPU